MQDRQEEGITRHVMSHRPCEMSKKRERERPSPHSHVHRKKTDLKPRQDPPADSKGVSVSTVTDSRSSLKEMENGICVVPFAVRNDVANKCVATNVAQR